MWLEIFDRGLAPVGFTIAASVPWTNVSPAKGEVTSDRDLRLQIQVDWAAAPEGLTNTTLKLQGSDGRQVAIALPIQVPSSRLKRALVCSCATWTS
jgi:hypothetical protein